MVVRYVRDQDIIPNEIKKTRRSVANAQRPTGTEIRQTADTADFAKELSQQLETELGPLPGQIEEALNEAAQALEEAGLARTEAAGAVADAQQAVADATQAIQDAANASQQAGAASAEAEAAQQAAAEAAAAAAAAKASSGELVVYPDFLLPSGGAVEGWWNRRSGTGGALVEFNGVGYLMHGVDDQFSPISDGPAVWGATLMDGAAYFVWQQGVTLRVQVNPATISENVWVAVYDGVGPVPPNSSPLWRLLPQGSSSHEFTRTAAGGTLAVVALRFEQSNGVDQGSAIRRVSVQDVSLIQAAQNRADEAFDEAVAAATAAGQAQNTADGKNRVWYQGTAPAGTGHKAADVWFNTSQGNRMSRWNGTTWTLVEFGGAALANSAVTAIKLADDAVTSAKIAMGAVDDDALAAAVKTAIATAQSTASNAQSVATDAANAAATAQGTASSAQNAAQQAAADALAAANAANDAQELAESKGDIVIQNGAPSTAYQLPTTLWIRTSAGANTPMRWNGTAWVAVTDKVATDAANAAVDAQNAADAAQQTANTAQSVANAAQTAASAAQTAADSAAAAAAAAQTSADGKSTVVRSTSAATAAGSYKQGDQWWQFSGANIIGLWLHSGTAWVAQALTNTIIATLDAGKINTGYLAAARIQAATITGTHIAGATITAANMVAGTITAASGIIATATIGTAQIIDLAVSSAKIADLAVTNAKIADATIQNAKIANLDAAKITTGTLNAARIAALSITTDKLASTSVTTEKIAALAVTAAEIAAGAVTAVKIAANAVTAEKINAGAVTTDKLNALAVTAEKIAAGAIIADKIAAGAITTAKLAATAIDGMTITGALIRTAPSGQRMEFDVNGLRSFTSAGAVSAQLSAATGGLKLNGAILLGDAINGVFERTLDGEGLSVRRDYNLAGFGAVVARGQADAGLMSASTRATDNREGRAVINTTPESAYILLDARDKDDPLPHLAARIERLIDKRLRIINDEGPIEIAATEAVTGGVSGTAAAPAIILTPGEDSVLVKGEFKHDTDTDWVYPVLTGGAVNVPGNEFGYRRKGGLVWLRGRVNCNDGQAIFQMPVGFKIAGGSDNVFLLDRGGTCRVNFWGNGNIVPLSGGTVGGGLTLTGFSYLPA